MSHSENICIQAYERGSGPLALLQVICTLPRSYITGFSPAQLLQLIPDDQVDRVPKHKLYATDFGFAELVSIEETRYVIRRAADVALSALLADPLRVRVDNIDIYPNNDTGFLVEFDVVRT